MAEIKTKATTASVKDFISAAEPEERRLDGFSLLKMFEDITGEKAVMWGPSIVGFGKYHYKSERSSQEGDWPLIGFSPRKQNLTLYITRGFEGCEELLNKLGKHKLSVGCLYVKRLSELDINVLKTLIDKSYKHAKKTLT